MRLNIIAVYLCLLDGAPVCLAASSAATRENKSNFVLQEVNHKALTHLRSTGHRTHHSDIILMHLQRNLMYCTKMATFELEAIPRGAPLLPIGFPQAGPGRRRPNVLLCRDVDVDTTRKLFLGDSSIQCQRN